MWSTRLLWTGVISAIAIAALMLAGIFVVLLVVSGESPGHGLANFVILASPGIITYPACWYAVIFRQRDYSRRQTLKLIGAAFGTVCAILALATLVGTLASMIGTPASKISPSVILSMPLIIAIWMAVGSAILGVPYLMVATPMALLHRWLLSKVFTATGFAD